MIREICEDEIFLAQKAEPAPTDDLPVAADLLETLTHHQTICKEQTSCPEVRAL